jgi:ribonucleotide reductase alpha subunit
LNQEVKKQYGPRLALSQEIHQDKYRLTGESFERAMTRVANHLKDGNEHFEESRDILLNMRFLPAGRVQSAVGSPREVTAYNCFVSGLIEDSMSSIMQRAAESAETQRRGGGIGYDFSRIRPRGTLIGTLDSKASGPISFMAIYDAICHTIASAGHRRGAQMGVLRVDHPDIEEFIRAKNNSGKLTGFNISVGITDEFMNCVVSGTRFPLRWEGRVYKYINAASLWEEIMRSTWDWAEPGVLFIDRINEMNNLYYCETIEATNPCLHPDTIIETVEGRIRIADMNKPMKVYTSMPDGSLGISQATSSWISKKNASVTKIKTRNGKEIKVTPDHKILTHDRGWVKAEDLKLGDRVVQLCRARRGSEYSGVKLTTEDNRAYRMEHRFIAEGVFGDLGNQVVHHINNDTYDNHIDNFEIMSESDHNKLTASTTHPQEHQVRDDTGKFISTGKSPKRITPMPEDLKSNLTNNYSNAIVEITKDFEITDVYDLSVEGTHNMIGNFMVVHNCGEQPLPPFGACLLGSFNTARYVVNGRFDFDLFIKDIPIIVRMMDNIIDRTSYPLSEQETEAKNKRRMGLGITGIANAAEACGYRYGSEQYLKFQAKVLKTLRDHAYWASVELAKEKGSFPLFDAEKYVNGNFIKTLPKDLREAISTYGIRNSHLTSIAPTGTISLTADNVSSGIEPPFLLEYERTIQTFDGPRVERVQDYGVRYLGVTGKTADQTTAKEHVAVLANASKYVDSAVSKTCNVASDVPFDDFKDLYMDAWIQGCKGITTFRAAGKRYGILNAVTSTKSEEPEDVPDSEGAMACFIDPETGQKSCE